MAKKDWTFNQSLLEAFKGCPRRGKYLTDRNRKDANSSRWANLGNAFHAFAAAYIEHLKMSEAVTDLHHAEFLAAWAAGEHGLVNDDRDSLIKAAEKFSKYFMLGPDVKEAFTEQRIETLFGVPTPRMPGNCVTLHGTPDLILVKDDVVEIYDWKMTYEIASLDECMARLQLRYYAMLYYMIAKGAPTEMEFKLVYYFARYGSERPFSMGHMNMVDFAKTIRTRIRDILEMTKYPAQPGKPHCGYCESAVLARCPEANDARAMSIKTPADAAKAVNKMQALKARLAGLDVQVRRFAADNGHIDMGDKELGFNPSKVKKIRDIKGLYDLLMESDITPETFWNMVSVSQAAVKQGVGHRPDLMKSIAEHLTVEESTARWGERRKGD